MGPLILLLVGWALLVFAANAYVNATEDRRVFASPFCIMFTTTGFNDHFFRQGIRHRFRFRPFYCSGGIVSTLGLFASLAMLMMSVWQSLARLFPHAESRKSLESSILTPLVPGVSIPFSHIAYLWVAVVISAIVHEAGHAYAAGCEGLRIERCGIFLAVLIPGAFVEIEPHIELVDPFKRIRIYSAGAWHNIVLTLISIVLLSTLPFALSPFYLSGDGVAVRAVFQESIFSSVLRGGSVIVGLDTEPISSHSLWVEAAVRISHTPPAGFCVSKFDNVTEYASCCASLEPPSLPIVFTNSSEMASNRSEHSDPKFFRQNNDTTPAGAICFIALSVGALPRSVCATAREVAKYGAKRCIKHSDCGLNNYESECFTAQVPRPYSLLIIDHIPPPTSPSPSLTPSPRRPLRPRDRLKGRPNAEKLYHMAHGHKHFHSPLLPLPPASPTSTAPQRSLFLALPSDLLTHLSLSDYRLRWTSLPMIDSFDFPSVIAMLLQYTSTISASIAVINLAPVVMLDGEFILKALRDYLAPSSPPNRVQFILRFSTGLLLVSILLSFKPLIFM